MNLTRFILCISLVISSGWALPRPASTNPDDDAETVDVIPAAPTAPPAPETPDVNSDPGFVLVPLHPTGGYGGYDGYGGVIQQPSFWSYYWPINPYSWNLGYISNLFNQLRSTATTTWSQIPSLTPRVNIWPPATSDSNTTSTTKIIDGKKVTINETVYTTKTAHGHSIYKVRTVDVQPVDDNEITTHVPASTPGAIPTSPPPSESGTTESDIEEIEPHDDIDGNVDIDELGNNNDPGSPEVFDASKDNEITKENEFTEVLR